MPVFQKFAGISVESQIDGSFKVALPSRSVKVLASVEEVRAYLGGLPLTELQDLAYVAVTLIKDVETSQITMEGQVRSALLQSTAPLLAALEGASFAFSLPYSFPGGEQHTLHFNELSISEIGSFTEVLADVPFSAEFDTTSILGIFSLKDQEMATLSCPIAFAVSVITPPEDFVEEEILEEGEESEEPETESEAIEEEPEEPPEE